MKITAFCGSLRKESYNKKLLLAVEKLLPQNIFMKIVDYTKLPLYNQDIEDAIKESGNNDFPEIKDFYNKITSTDAYLIVSPEYNYSLPGGLKNALDWISRLDFKLLRNKPVSLMGATPGNLGTVRMQQAFLPFFNLYDMKLAKPEIFVSNVMQKFDTEGNLLDEELKELIIKNIGSLKN